VLLLAVLLPSLVLARDFYKILGLTEDASDGEIKKAYRKMSLKYHPDKTKGDAEAQKRFIEIKDAYETLSDPEKKQIYDYEGEEGLKQAATQAQQGGGFNPLAELFGFGGGQQQGGRRKGPAYKTEYPVTLEDLYNGNEKQLNINRKVLCRKCKGTGARDGQVTKCHHCGGKGVRMTVQQVAPGFNVQMQAACDHCSGKGHVAAAACPHCRGSKRVDEDKKLDIVIEKGMPDGHEIIFERASEHHPEMTPGDVVLTLKTQPHPRFTRRGHDLHITRRISLKEALLGFTVKIMQLDGRELTVTNTAVTPHDHVNIIRGEGMPHHDVSSVKGDMHVRFHVEFPTVLTQAQKDGIKNLLP